MTEVVINLERGPDDQPTGQLTTGTGQTIPFSGWLELIRVLEDELRQSPRPTPSPRQSQASLQRAPAPGSLGGSPTSHHG